jgi:hypothetical protein
VFVLNDIKICFSKVLIDHLIALHDGINIQGVNKVLRRLGVAIGYLVWEPRAYPKETNGSVFRMVWHMCLLFGLRYLMTDGPLS